MWNWQQQPGRTSRGSQAQDGSASKGRILQWKKGEVSLRGEVLNVGRLWQRWHLHSLDPDGHTGGQTGSQHRGVIRPCCTPPARRRYKRKEDNGRGMKDSKHSDVRRREREEMFWPRVHGTDGAASHTRLLSLWDGEVWGGKVVPALLQTGQEGCWIKDGVKPNATQNTCVVQSSRMHRGSTHPGIRRVNHPTHGHSLTLTHTLPCHWHRHVKEEGMMEWGWNVRADLFKDWLHLLFNCNQHTSVGGNTACVCVCEK